MSQLESPKPLDAAKSGARRVYLYGADRERNVAMTRPVVAAFSGGGCGGVVR